MSASKLWQSASTKLHPLVEKYTVGNDYKLDKRLLPHDLEASRAHAKALQKINILTNEELQKLLESLDEILLLSKKGEFKITLSDEDCHTAIENYLVKKLGPLGKKIHTGRSRNDQVLIATRLYTKKKLDQISEELIKLQHVFLNIAKEYEYLPMPGYTHTRRAMPSSVGHWAAAYLEELINHHMILESAYKLNNQNPMGAAAGFGSCFPIDRQFTTDELGLDRVQINSLYCVNSRGMTESYILSVMTQIMLTLGRLSNEIIWFTTPEFDFFDLPYEFTTGSSIMPQKRNPDIFEIVRSNVGIIVGLQTQVKDICKGNISGYNRDTQLTKEPLIKGLGITRRSLEVVSLVMTHIKPKKKVLMNSLTPELFAANEAYKLVKEGMPFRDAYQYIKENLDKINVPDPIEGIKEVISLGGPGNLSLDKYILSTPLKQQTTQILNSQIIQKTKILYQEETKKATENFTVSGVPFSKKLAKNIAKIKLAASETNSELGNLEFSIAKAINQASIELIEGKHDSNIVVDQIQGGAGTSMHMNINEIIATRATNILGGVIVVHPIDHVNMGQSTNDVVPTAMKITTLEMLDELLPVYKQYEQKLKEKGDEFMNIIKVGRTHLQDAVPMTLGQEFHAHASAVSRDIKKLSQIKEELYTTNMGGTAIGTGINSSNKFIQNIAYKLSQKTGYNISPANNLIDSTQYPDSFFAVSSTLSQISSNMIKCMNDLRLLASGPRTGFGEISFQAIQKGSSIMPGKINPVMAEMMNQICFQIIGNNQTIMLATQAGQLELNVMLPIVAKNLFESLSLLKNGLKSFISQGLENIVANEKQCKKLFEQSLSAATALCPIIGYDTLARVVKQAQKEEKTLKQVLKEESIIEEYTFQEALKPQKLTKPTTL